MLHISVYSTVRTSIPLEQRDIEWEEVVEFLNETIIADNKDDVPLFNFVKFAPGKPRQKKFATTVTGFILDIDNTTCIDGVKVDLDAPILPEVIQDLLAPYEYVLVSTHSHTGQRIRFRVFMPLAEPISATTWLAHAAQALKQLRLSNTAGVDPCCHLVTQPYYFPSAMPGAPTLFHHNRGDWLKIEPPQAEEITHQSGDDDRFTIPQVTKYWMARCPEINDYEPGPDFRVLFPCPLHTGQRNNFQVNLLTGQWICYSECSQKAGKPFGGDIYQYERIRYGKSWEETKQNVNNLLGIIPDESLVPESELTPAEDLSETIEVIPPDAVPDLIAEIVKHKPSVRENLLQQLTQQTGLGEKEIKRLVALAVSQVTATSTVTSRGQFDFGIPHELRFGTFGYDLLNEGVVKMKLITPKDGPPFWVADRTLTTQPIWISALGHNLSSGKLMTQISWFGVKGKIYREWHPSTVSNDRETLVKLDDPPVDQQDWIGISKYLNSIRSHVKEERDVSDTPGWVEHEGKWKYVWPGVSDIDYIGPPYPSLGTAEDWAKPLDDIIPLGRDGYVALMCVGLACAAPAVRFLDDNRNPIIALCFKSSQGKGTLIKYALSIFSKPIACTIPVNSTVKGAQDMLKKMADMAAFVDEVQQMRKNNRPDAENIIYAMGNATDRVTSSKTKEVNGGNFSPGVRYMAAEESIITNMQGGAAMRTVEMTEAPLPPNSDALVKAIQHASASNYGALAPLLAEYYSKNRASIKVEIELEAENIKATHPLMRGEDHYTVALMYVGVKILGELVDRTFPLDDIKEWLIDYLKRERSQMEDQADTAFRRTLSWLWSTWESTSSTTGDGKGSGPIALRGVPECDPATPLEILHETMPVRQHFKDINMPMSTLKVWADRGYIESQNDKHEFSRRRMPVNGAKVIRVTADGLAKFGYPRDGKPEIQP